MIWERHTFHFVCTNLLEAKLLEQCGCRNILISYAFIKRFRNTLGTVRDKFDKIFLDSGAFTAWKKGKEVNMQEYCDFLKREKDNYDVVAQLDSIGDLEKTIANYIHMVKEGVDWTLPILQGNWEQALYQFEPHLVTDYLGVGSDVYYRKGGKDQYHIIRNLPKKYRLHGFAKGNNESFKNGWMYSIDSSTWSFGARGREAVAWSKGANLGVQFGLKGKTSRNDLRYLHSTLKDDFEACGIDAEKMIEGEYNTILMITAVIYYRPLFRQYGIFKKNFKF